MIRVVLAAVLATTLCAMAIGSRVSAAKFPEYDKVWEDGKLKKPKMKGLKTKTPRPKDSKQKPVQ